MLHYARHATLRQTTAVAQPVEGRSHGTDTSFLWHNNIRSDNEFSKVINPVGAVTKIPFRSHNSAQLVVSGVKQEQALARLGHSNTTTANQSPEHQIHSIITIQCHAHQHMTLFSAHLAQSHLSHPNTVNFKHREKTGIF